MGEAFNEKVFPGDLFFLIAIFRIAGKVFADREPQVRQSRQERTIYLCNRASWHQFFEQAARLSRYSIYGTVRSRKGTALDIVHACTAGVPCKEVRDFTVQHKEVGSNYERSGSQIRFSDQRLDRRRIYCHCFSAGFFHARRGNRRDEYSAQLATSAAIAPFLSFTGTISCIRAIGRATILGPANVFARSNRSFTVGSPATRSEYAASLSCLLVDEQCALGDAIGHDADRGPPCRWAAGSQDRGRRHIGRIGR